MPLLTVDFKSYPELGKIEDMEQYIKFIIKQTKLIFNEFYINFDNSIVFYFEISREQDKSLIVDNILKQLSYYGTLTYNFK